MVGIDVGGTKIDVAVVADGSRRVRRIPTDADRGAAAAIERALTTAADLADGPVAAVGIAVPGAVDNGAVRLADNVPGLDDLDLPSMVESVFTGAPLALVNDLNAAATAQIAAGIIPSDGIGVVVGLGTGTAAGIVVDGVLRPGARGSAGEIGYSRIPTSLEDSNAPLSRLEEFAGGRAFDRLAASAGLSGARELLDPDALVVFGGMSAHPLVRNRIEKALAEELPHPPRVRWLPPDGNASLDGALHHAAMLTDPGRTAASAGLMRKRPRTRVSRRTPFDKAETPRSPMTSLRPVSRPPSGRMVHRVGSPSR